MSDKSADLITLADAIEKIGQARHGAAWVSLNDNLETFRVRLETGNTPDTVAATVANFKKNKELRTPIELEIIGKLQAAELPTYWRPSGSDLLPIAPDQWNSFELEANRYWPNANINGKSETVYLDQSSLEIFAGISPRKASVTKYGRRKGEGWLIADVPIFKKMAVEIVKGVNTSVAAKKYASEAEGAGTEESKATRLRKAYRLWADCSR